MHEVCFSHKIWLKKHNNSLSNTTYRLFLNIIIKLIKIKY